MGFTDTQATRRKKREGVTSLVVFLDANSVIYLIDQPPMLGSKANAETAVCRKNRRRSHR
jgi:hypothetical protein